MARRRKKVAAKTTPAKTTTAQRGAAKQYSTAGISTVEFITNTIKPWELARQNRLRTYQQMVLDDAIKSGLELRTTLIENSQADGYFKYDANNPVSAELADFFRYVQANMDGQTVRSIARTQAEFISNGISPTEFIGKKAGFEYPDRWTLSKLAYINPLTLDQNYPYHVAEGGDEIVYLRQNLSAFASSMGRVPSGLTGGVKEIPWNRVFYCSYSSTPSQPFGVSALDACYTPWREKILLQDYALMGVTKDFAGTPVLYVPQALCDEAAADPSSLSGQTLSRLTTGMANMNAGDQNFVVLPSDTQSETGQGARDFEIKFLGVEGGGKGFDIIGLVEQRRRAILTALGAPNLINSEKGGGSFNLAEGQAAIQAHYAKRDTAIVSEMWNKQIFPMILKLNEIKVKSSDIPVWVGGEVQPLSHEVYTSGLQKLGAASLLPSKSRDFVNEVLESAGIRYRIDPSDENWLEQMSDYTSESGSGMTEGLNNGMGTSTSKGADRSVANKDRTST